MEYDLKQNDCVKIFFILNFANVPLLMSTIMVSYAKIGKWNKADISLAYVPGSKRTHRPLNHTSTQRKDIRSIDKEFTNEQREKKIWTNYILTLLDKTINLTVHNLVKIAIYF